jgi:hypothetical protein
MKSTTFILSTLLVAQALFFIDARAITATIPNSTHDRAPQHVATLAGAANGLNEECKSVPPDQDPDENWNMEKTFDFSDRGKSYRLVYSWKLPESTSLCLIEGKTATPIIFKQGAYYIDKVERVRVKLFNVQIHEGNGNNVPATKYQLNLGQPQNPKLKVLKRWILK